MAGSPGKFSISLAGDLRLEKVMEPVRWELLLEEMVLANKESLCKVWGRGMAVTSQRFCR